MNLSKYLLTTLLLWLILCPTFGQRLTDSQAESDRATLIIQDNEFESDQVGQHEKIYCNPLVLDGKKLDYGSFTLKSTGELALVKGDPESKEATNIPFNIHLRRNGAVVTMENKDIKNKAIYDVDISKVLAYGQPGDQLIIEPVNEVDWKAKRILKLIP